ncbi:MAG: hypothetical protein QXS00_01035 [Pyrobaculum sp.]|uniref:hypothetical protein n=1 Tax=Pyrobaculum sp. TaxID=2004705 RepID=UPI003166C738
MVVDEERFRPYRPQEAVRLDPGRHVGEFVELKKPRGQTSMRDKPWSSSKAEVLRGL